MAVITAVVEVFLWIRSWLSSAVGEGFLMPPRHYGNLEELEEVAVQDLKALGER
jgi:hypothetical protein